ncbi:MAG TPA: hypothetical protein VMZ92_00885 [Planctomycetota bacterium]|nr:hypothetical protein [Planctomycetota bacterium]
MSARIVIRVHPDERVEVKVEGLKESQASAPPGARLCEKLTRRLEKDLGQVVDRTYEHPESQELDQQTDERRQQELHG